MVKKRPQGRPSKFPKIDKEQLKSLVLDGWTDKQVSDFFGINVSTLTRWKQKHESFCISLKEWKKEADKHVVKSLYKRANGYEHKETTVEPRQIIKYKDGQRISMKFDHNDLVTTKVVTKQLAPDPTSMIFWLKNRQPQHWRDKHEHTVSGIADLLKEASKKGEKCKQQRKQ